jgi:hypothetical protein
MATEIILAHLYHITFITHFRGKNSNQGCVYSRKEKFSIEDIRKEALLKWVETTKNMIKRDYYVKQNAKIEDFELKGIEVIYKGSDRWWCSWFSHETFSKFDTEREMFDDFEKFLKEKGVHLGYSSEYPGYCEGDEKTKYQDMGAADAYRWTHCKCDGCIKYGRTIINH